MEQQNNQFSQPNNQYIQQFQEQQPMMMKTHKKPKKIGWIISLIIVGIGILGFTFGGVMALSNNPKPAIESLEKEIDDNPAAALIGPHSGDEASNSKYEVKKGNGFVLIFLNRDSGDVPKIIVDGKVVSAFYTERDTKIARKDAKVKSYYYVVAASDEMSVELEGQGSENGFHFLVGKGEVIAKVMPVINTTLISILIMIVSGIISFISLILFIVFLVIFLTKNNAYKMTRNNF